MVLTKSLIRTSKYMRADKSSPNDISLCSFGNYVTDKTSYHIAMDRIKRDVTKSNIIDEMVRDVGLLLKKAMTPLIELRKRSAKFN